MPNNQSMRTIIPGELPNPDLYQYLVGAVAPRPIALVSSLNAAGATNLAPYSFFNVFSIDPPVCVFSTTRRGPGDNFKDTLNNIRTTGECVINIVNHQIVRQMAVTGCDFPPEQSEFEASGLTPLAAERVQPFRVAESPVHLECTLRDIISLGDNKGAGQLVICDIVCMHVREDIIDERNRIHPQKLDAMGRMGRAYYVRVSGEAIRTIIQPRTPVPIGYTALPASARTSSVLTGNDLGRLAGLPGIPTAAEIEAARADTRTRQVLATAANKQTALHQLAQRELAMENIVFAASVVWLGEEM